MGVNLKDAEEVKEYLKNLYMEYRFGCESEKRPEVCHLLGDYEETVRQNKPRAVALYKENCDVRNHGRSCAKYGSYTLVGKGCELNVEEGYKYAKRGCELGDAYGCYYAGTVAFSEHETDEKDRATQVAKGVEMLSKSCYEYGLEKACYSLSCVYLTGIKGYVEPNLHEAYKSSLKACEGDNAYACANVSQMYARGEGVEKNPGLAEIFKERATKIHQECTEIRRTTQFQQGIDG